MVISPMETAVRECIGKGRFRLDPFHRTSLDCMTCMAMYGSGLRTVGIVITAERRRTAERGPVEGIATIACCAAVPGATIRGTCVRRSAA